VTTKSYLTTVTLSEGNTYNFYVIARNSVGFSTVSSTISILAAQKPDMPLNVVTTVVANGVTISWTA